MASLNVSLPEDMKEFVEQQAAEEGFPTTDAYLLKIIADARGRRAEEALRAKLREGLDSPLLEANDEFWAELEREILEKSPELRQS